MRYSSNDIIEVGRLTSGTSAEFIGYNIKTQKKGIYKQNGCVLGIDNDDIREKLSSEILILLGIDAASIDLVFNEETGQDSYFSNYIIQDNEELISPDTIGCESLNPNPIDNMCERYIQGVRKLTNTEQFLEASRKNFYQYTYICCILDCYDIKPDNLPLMHNKDTNSFSIAPWFDFGTAFFPEHKSSAFYETDTDEMLESLFQNHYEDISIVANKVHSILTPDKISELVNSEYVTQSMNSSEVKNIQTRLNEQIAKSIQFDLEKTTYVKSEINRFKSFFASFKQKLSSIFKKTKQLPSKVQEVQNITSNDGIVTYSNNLDNLSTLVNETPDELEQHKTDFVPPEL